MKKLVAIIAIALLTSGCSDPFEIDQEKVVGKTPTIEQVQKTMKFFTAAKPDGQEMECAIVAFHDRDSRRGYGWMGLSCNWNEQSTG